MPGGKGLGGSVSQKTEKRQLSRCRGRGNGNAPVIPCKVRKAQREVWGSQDSTPGIIKGAKRQRRIVSPRQLMPGGDEAPDLPESLPPHSGKII